MIRVILLSLALGACAQSAPVQKSEPRVTYKRAITVNLDAPKPKKIQTQNQAQNQAQKKKARLTVSAPVQQMKQSRPKAAPRLAVKKRKPVIYKKAGLEGRAITKVRQKLGAPDMIQREGDIMLWTYKVEGCAVHLLVDGDTVKSVAVRKVLIHSAAIKADKPCFHRFVKTRLDRNRDAAALGQ